MRKLIAAVNMTLVGFCHHDKMIADDELAKGKKYGGDICERRNSCAFSVRLPKDFAATPPLFDGAQESAA